MDASASEENLVVSRKGNLLNAGEDFHGYVVERLLSRGGLGEVYLVRHAVLDTLFALKVLYPDAVHDNPEYVKRFLREAKLATRIRHPNLVAVHDCGHSVEKDLYWLVMDYASGGDLRQILAMNGRFAPDEAVDVILQVASALEAAQRFSVVHRDIKPENIMIQSDGMVKLVDLGIAKAADIENTLKTASDRIFGTPAYISPEQAVCAADVDQRADIYSLGVVLFEMVGGKCPYSGKNPTEIIAKVLDFGFVPDVRECNPDVPPALAAIIRRMCEKDRERRIPSASALIDEFSRAGYARRGGRGESKAQYAPIAGGGAASDVGFDLTRLPEKANHTLSFDTDDKEIQRFVTKLKRRRLIRRLIVAALAALALAAVAWFVLTVCAGLRAHG